MKFEVEVYRKNDRWYLHFRLPRWLLDELEKSSYFMKMSSSSINLSDPEDSTILYEGYSHEEIKSDASESDGS